MRQVGAALRLGLASHWQRPRHLWLIASGFLIAAAILMLLLAIPAGLERLGAGTGRNDVAIVFSASAQDEVGSRLKPEAAALLGDLPGVAHGVDGKPRVAPQFVATSKLRRRDGAAATVLVRGVTPMTRDVLGDALRLDAGDWFRSGIDELVAGAGAASNFIALDPGDRIKLRDTLWRVSGRFIGGGLWESELWADIAPLQASFNAPAALSVLWVRLESPAAFSIFEAALAGDPRLHDLRTERQSDYYARQLRFVSHFVRLAAIGIALALGLGAIVTIANALTLALIARRRELAVLRALGFDAGSLLLGLLLEIFVIAALTTAMILLLGWLLLDGMAVGSSTGQQSISFTLALTPSVLAWTLGYAVLIGLLAAIVPARIAVRGPLILAMGAG